MNALDSIKEYGGEAEIEVVRGSSSNFGAGFEVEKYKGPVVLMPKKDWDDICRMREAQKNYFRSRSKTVLENAKQIESRVDRAIADAKDPQDYLFK